jgi:methionyl-tRNA formyltransferase
VLRAILAFHPRPGAWVPVEGKRLRLHAAAPAPGVVLPAGRIEWAGGRLLLGTGDGAVELVTVQPEGGTAVSGRSWANGRRGEPAWVDETGGT